jgi:hypothetical protein
VTVILTAILIHDPEKFSLPNTALSTICKVTSFGWLPPPHSGLLLPHLCGALDDRIPFGEERCLRAGIGGCLPQINGPEDDRIIFPG